MKQLFEKKVKILEDIDPGCADLLLNVINSPANSVVEINNFIICTEKKICTSINKETYAHFFDKLNEIDRKIEEASKSSIVSNY